MVLAGTVLFLGRVLWRMRCRWRTSRTPSTASCVGGDDVTSFAGGEMPVRLDWGPCDVKIYPGAWVVSEDRQAVDPRDHVRRALDHHDHVHDVFQCCDFLERDCLTSGLVTRERYGEKIHTTRMVAACANTTSGSPLNTRSALPNDPLLGGGGKG
eukprot:2203561-Pyramimonas_sp.AAC.1